MRPHAAASMIRTGNSHKLESVIQAGGSLGMQAFDAVLRDLVRKKVIDIEEAHHNALDRTAFESGLPMREAA